MPHSKHYVYEILNKISTSIQQDASEQSVFLCMMRSGKTDMLVQFLEDPQGLKVLKQLTDAQVKSQKERNLTYMEILEERIVEKYGKLPPKYDRYVPYVISLGDCDSMDGYCYAHVQKFSAYVEVLEKDIKAMHDELRKVGGQLIHLQSDVRPFQYPKIEGPQ
jgi:hypothetical protein